MPRRSRRTRGETTFSAAQCRPWAYAAAMLYLALCVRRPRLRARLFLSMLAWTWLGACGADDDCARMCSDERGCPARCQGVTGSAGPASRADGVGRWQPASWMPRAAADAAVRPGTGSAALPGRGMASEPTPARVLDEDAGAAACVPRREVCDGLDDDCDRRIDEGCTCAEGQTSPCYDGAPGTLGVGSCRAGESRCELGTWRACAGAVTPQLETCNGMDDDCDGKLDEGYAFDSDPANCGSCGRTCAGAATCCGGRCVDLTSDAAHCGACGAACTAGQLPGCCSGSCVDLLTDRTCGSCSNACGLLKLGGGFLCHCQLVEEGPACVGDALGMGLMVCR